jgi:predicted ATPase/DNA-binding XRE family transcriptional regulator
LDKTSGLVSNRFGDLLREHRLRLGFSQEHLAERAGISLEAVSSLERGTRKSPYRSTIQSLVIALELGEVAATELEEAAAQAHARFSSSSRGSKVANNLFVPLSSFIGREKDVAKIRQALSGQRLVTIVGAAGIGKTRVALRLASDLLSTDLEGVWFVDLSALREGELIPAAILSALSVAESRNRPALETLIGHLKSRRRVLLILDNCEHVIHGAGLVSNAILQQCPTVTILATSREILGLAGERIVRLSTLSDGDSLALFAERASDADSRFMLTEELVPTIMEICRRLDGIALAIELAAARTNVLSPLALAQVLDERLLILTRGARTAPPRHRTLRAMLDWSYDLLEPKEQRAFRRLAVFVGGFTLELATALCSYDEPIGENQMIDLLGSFVDKSLVQYETRDDTTRYRLLESTRQYAQEKLRDHRELEHSVRAHGVAMLDHVALFSPLNFISDVAWKTQAQPEIENWRAALHWAFGSGGDVFIGQRLVAAMNDLWFSQATEAWRWVQRALEACSDATPIWLRARLELAQVIISYPLGRAQTTETLLATERAQHLFEEARDPLGVAMAQVFLGERLVHKGEIAEAERLLNVALTAAREFGAQRLVAMATRYLGMARGFAGDLDTARQLLRASIAMYSEAGAISGGRAIAGLNLAEFEFRAGDAETALRLALASIESDRNDHRDFSVCVITNNAAAYAIALDRFDHAREYTAESIALAAAGGFDLQFAWAAQHLAALAAFDEKNFREAARILGFVDLRLVELERQRTYTEQQEYARLVEALNTELGPDVDALLHEGAGWSASMIHTSR